MTMNDSTDQFGTLLEDVNHKFDILVEGQAALGPLISKVDRIDERLERVEARVETIQQVVTSQSYSLNSHEKRITALEAK